MAKQLMLFWQNPANRRWLPVGRLVYSDNVYEFCYTKEAQAAYEQGVFLPFGAMREFDNVYVSDRLFPTFKNRLLTKSRPEYKEYLEWLGLNVSTTTDMDELERSGGGRATDNLQMMPYPENQAGYYKVQFFAHGLRHIPQQYNGRLRTLQQGDSLYLMRDVQNKINPNALAIRTDDPLEVVGYCPNFLVDDISKLLDAVGANNIKISVLKVNVDAPLQFMLRCELSSVWAESFTPFSGEGFLLAVADSAIPSAAAA